MAKINAVEVHETRHSVELSPDEVRAAIESYAYCQAKGDGVPDARIVGATIKRLVDSVPRPPAALTELQLGGGVVVEWTSNHLPKAAVPSIPPAAPIGRVYDGSSAGKLEMPQPVPNLVPPPDWDDDRPSPHWGKDLDPTR